MKIGDLVKICWRTNAVGLLIGTDPEFVSRSIVFWDGDKHSVPTFQLSVVK